MGSGIARSGRCTGGDLDVFLRWISQNSADGAESRSAAKWEVTNTIRWEQMEMR
jgi:hypothetical protein